MSNVYNKHDGALVVGCQQQNIGALLRGHGRHWSGNSHEGNVAPCLLAIDIYRLSILYSFQVVLIDRLVENEVLTAVGWSASG